MDFLITLGVLALLFIGLVAPILSVVSFLKTRDLRAELAALRIRLDVLEATRAAAASTPSPTESTTAPPTASATESGTAGEPQPEQTRRQADQPTDRPPDQQAVPVPAVAWTQAATAATAAPSSEASGLDRFERQVTSRWFVWLGAATLGLAGVFLVKEAAERGWLGPGVRVTLGSLGGLALIALAEFLRRRFPEGGRVDYVPAALSSGGFLSCYASLYAAGQLFGFLSPSATFVAMAAVVLAAGLVSILHGPFLALLGSVGGFLLPGLIASTEPNGWVLFVYLAALVGGSLQLARLRPWLWLGWIALAGSVAWSLLWIDMPRAVAPVEPLGLFLVVMLAAFLAFAPLIGRAFVTDDAVLPWWRNPQPLAFAAGIAVALLCFALVRIDDYRATGLVVLALVAALLTFAARRHRPMEYLSVVAAVLTVASLATWHLPAILSAYEPIVYEASGTGLGWAPHVPPAATAFLTACLVFGAAHAVAGFVALWGAARPILWAALSAVVPLLVTIAAYWRLKNFDVDVTWAAGALVLASLMLAAAARVAPYRDDARLGNVLGIYAAAVTAAIALAMAMTLRDAWLSVALALQLPALAWIHRRLPVASLRVIAGIVAAVLCARLAFNPDVFSYQTTAMLGDHWPLYGYGLPLLATYLAWRHFAASPPDWLDAWLRAVTFGLAALLVAFEIDTVIWNSIAAADAREYPWYMEFAFPVPMHVIGGLAMAVGLLQRVDQGAALVVWVRRLLFVLASLAAIGTLIDSPVWRAFETGPWPVLNMLLLAYLAPAALMLAFARQARLPADRPIEPRGFVFAAAGLALVLGFAWVTLETRHAFRGPNLAAGTMSDAESYAYSAVWLLYAGVLLAGGLWQKSQALRIGSLVVVMAAVLKVFLVDMDDLEGLWRVASFLGLGLALVGIGFLYQRLVFLKPTSGATSG